MAMGRRHETGMADTRSGSHAEAPTQGVAPPSIRATLADGLLPRLETRMLWQHVLGCTHAWLVAHDTDPLDAAQTAQFLALRARRLQGEPMAYLLGSREFMGHDFMVSPAVLIPRPETELLVDCVLQAAGRIRRATGRTTIDVLELGTGSGAIAVSAALADAGLAVTATDLSQEALAVAQQNAARLGGIVEFRAGSWYDAISVQKQYDIIVSNPPYIASGDAHLQQGDLRFEPFQALTDGADGMQALRAIIDGAVRHLTPGGEVWLEHGWDQAQGVRACLREAGFDDVRSQTDLAGIERVSGATLSFVQQESRT